MDHIVPLHKDGTNAIDNLQMLCREHHREKTDDELVALRGPLRGCDEMGWPRDSTHHWLSGGGSGKVRVLPIGNHTLATAKHTDLTFWTEE